MLFLSQSYDTEVREEYSQPQKAGDIRYPKPPVLNRGCVGPLKGEGEMCLKYLQKGPKTGAQHLDLLFAMQDSTYLEESGQGSTEKR
jgi:hypothetical protein